RWGIAGVFRRCGALSPRGARLVIVSVILWLPLSAALSVGMHAVLLAHASSLPAWMQLLHPVATVIAKTKLLVLPAYPAAWPQAKRHPFVRGVLESCRRFTNLDVVQKTGHRYRQADKLLQRSRMA